MSTSATRDSCSWGNAAERLDGLFVEADRTRAENPGPTCG
jgi:hypothetical protein